MLMCKSKACLLRKASDPIYIRMSCVMRSMFSWQVQAQGTRVSFFVKLIALRLNYILICSNEPRPWQSIKQKVNNLNVLFLTCIKTALLPSNRESSRSESEFSDELSSELLPPPAEFLLAPRSLPPLPPESLSPPELFLPSFPFPSPVLSPSSSMCTK